MFRTVTPVLRAGFIFLALAASIWSVIAAEDLVISDFRGADWNGWTATGRAFGKGPVRGDELLRKLEIENSRDSSVASSELEGDKPVGRLTSPEFTISRRFIAFRIGGGDSEHFTCLNLLIDGQPVRSATGWRSDRLAQGSWDVSAWFGKKARIEVVDEASGDWGHINVDDLVQTDAPERAPIEVAPLYHEALRPQFHFTARQWTMRRLNPKEKQEGWVNDLNGLIYYDGEYHLFAQRWARCWIHAVSRDLVHWTELQPAFWEEKPDSGVQSGTCVVDYKNTSGLSPDPANPPMVAFWSRFDNLSQCISYTLDHGRTWKMYDKNPHMKFPERDPKVFWHEPSRHWVMMMYGQNQYHIFTSTNLLNWKNEGHPIPNSYECPDFFELPVDGNSGNKKWVLIQGNGKYSVGTFDGHEFKEETERFPCDVGPNFYATQTWGNVETGDGRRIQAAWMRGAVFPDMPFNQQISFPCELKLRGTTKGLRLFREPIHEIETLHNGKDEWTNRTLNARQSLPLEPDGECFHIIADVEIPKESKLIFNLRGMQVVLTAASIESAGTTTQTLEAVDRIEILLDRTSMEAFVNHGEISSTRYFLPKENSLSVRAEHGPVSVKQLTVYPLRSAWKN